MPREKAAYRDQLEALTAHFGPVGMVSRKQVIAYTGKCGPWVTKHLQVGRQGITLPVLARRLLDVCGE